MNASNSSPDSSPEEFLSIRRRRLRERVGRPLSRPPDTDLGARERRHLREEAEELYWNELSWEQLTAEQRAEGAALVEHVFSGLLAFVEGLLLQEAPEDALAEPTPRPEVVEEILRFLAGRCLELRGAEEPSDMWERQVTERLIDLVLYRLHELPVDRAERIEPSAADG